MNKILQAAKWYQANGYNVIPIQHNKKPFVEWAKFQTERVTEAMIGEWWGKWPGAMIGIVTGKISGLMVVDVDTQKGHDLLNDLLPDTLLTPIARTPGGGWHYYFKYQPGLVNKARVIEGCDIRTDGGYIIAPPSKNGKGEYRWS